MLNEKRVTLGSATLEVLFLFVLDREEIFEE